MPTHILATNLLPWAVPYRIAHDNEASAFFSYIV